MKRIIIILIAILFISGCATVPKEKIKRAVPVPKKAPILRYAMRAVIIDPGHGGKDPGAIARGHIREKHIVLNIAKLLKSYLEDEGISAVLTRDSDRFISLFKRADIANKINADFFISIHANIARAKYVNGIEVFYLSEAVDDFSRQIAASENAALQYENSSFSIGEPKQAIASTLWDMLCTENRAESIELAQCISKAASKALEIKNRGVKAAKFYVLKGTQMPAVLVEVGFISNKDEAKKLQDPQYQDRLAKAIAGGVILYKQQYEHTDGFTR